MRAVVAVLIFLQALSCAAAAEEPAKTVSASSSVEEQAAKFLRSDSYYPLDRLNQRRKFINTSVETDSGLGRIGLEASFGYYFGPMLAVDIRGTLGMLNYRSIRASPNDRDDRSAPVVTDPNAEINRVRGDGDRWSYLTVEPGISVSSRLFPGKFPKLTESARVGFGYGRFFDQTSNIGFTTQYLLSFEAQLAWRFSEPSPWSWITHLALTQGVLGAQSGASQTDSSEARLPVTWTQFGVGLQYSLR